jgi:hypothetical protein
VSDGLGRSADTPAACSGSTKPIAADSPSTSSRAAIADLIRPALNEYPDGTLRVSKGQGDAAETVVQIVWQAMDSLGWYIYEPLEDK